MHLNAILKRARSRRTFPSSNRRRPSGRDLSRDPPPLIPKVPCPTHVEVSTPNHAPKLLRSLPRSLSFLWFSAFFLCPTVPPPRAICCSSSISRQHNETSDGGNAFPPPPAANLCCDMQTEGVRIDLPPRYPSPPSKCMNSVFHFLFHP